MARPRPADDLPAGSAPQYPLFPRAPAGAIASLRVSVLRVVRGNTRPPVKESLAWEWDPRTTTRREIERLWGGRHYLAEGIAENGQLTQWADAWVCHGAELVPSPAQTEQEKFAARLAAPTAHETAQQAALTFPGLDPIANAAIATYQVAAHAAREDALRAHTLMAKLMEQLIANQSSELAKELRNELKLQREEFKSLVEKYEEQKEKNSALEKGRKATIVDQALARALDNAPMLLEGVKEKIVEIVHATRGEFSPPSGSAPDPELSAEIPPADAS